MDGLRLTPLQAFGPLFERWHERMEQTSDDETAQVYARSGEKARLDYTALHDSITSAHGAEAWSERFQELFPLSEWREQDRGTGGERIEGSSPRRGRG